MDFLALFITIRIMHKKIYKIRILISALLGGAYSIFEILITINNPIVNITINILVSLIMCLITFKEKKIGRLLVIYMLFWGASALMGGVMSLMFSAFNKLFYQYIVDLDIVNSSSYNGTRFIVIMLISIIVSILLSKIYTNKKDIKNAEIKIWLNDNTYKLTGLCDSGNLLVEPLSGRSVVLISSFTKLGKEVENQPEYKKRYIPFSGVDSKGLLKGIIPTKIIINDNEVDALIATTNEKDYSGFDALVPSALL
jgi:sigma-E processing peptidase SpoIIGA